jgi:DNA-binding MarR family transcriptional regulator
MDKPNQPTSFSSQAQPGAAAISELTLAVFSLNGALREWGNQQVKPFELTSSRWQVLGALFLAGCPQTVPQVCAAMGVTRQGAQRQINLLVDQKLIRSRRNPDHQRSTLYELTAQGHALYQQINAMWVEQANSFSALNQHSEIVAATKTLKRVLGQVQDAIDSFEDKK